jgi:hypothetical protein
MSKSIRTRCVGVAFYVGILHDARVDSDTMRGWTIPRNAVAKNRLVGFPIASEWCVLSRMNPSRCPSRFGHGAWA